MKKQIRRLALNRETLLRLDEATLRKSNGALVIAPYSQDPGCDSPLCGPTYWQTCDTYVATA